MSMAVAIDFHVHPATREATEALAGPPEQTADFFHGAVPLVSIDETAAQYRQLDLVAVLLGIDAETTTSIPAVSNDYVADAVRRHPDVFVGYASVDPWKGTLAVEELERAVRELGLRGLKLHPGRQEFFPDDPRFAPLFARCAALAHVAVAAGANELVLHVDDDERRVLRVEGQRAGLRNR
jgi:predicted TIM-barrel fold metal-dependent hydrolase